MPQRVLFRGGALLGLYVEVLTGGSTGLGCDECIVAIPSASVGGLVEGGSESLGEGGKWHR